MEFRIIESSEINQYDRLVEACSGSLLYHSSKFLNFISNVLDCEIEIHGYYNGHQLVAACPWLKKKGSKGYVYNSLAYFGSNGGIIWVQNELDQSFEKQMMSYLENHAASVTYITSTFSDNKLSDSTFNSIERLAQVSILPEMGDNVEERLIEICHPKNRTKIRKGLKGLTFEISQEYDFLSQVHKENMQFKGVAYKPTSFFESLSRYFEFEKDYRIFNAKMDGESCCSILVFYHKETMVYYVPALKVEFRNRQALSGLIYHIMVHGIKHGYKFWDWGGTPKSNIDLYKFKERWGTEDRPYEILNKVINQELHETEPEELQLEYPGFFVKPY